MTKAEFLAEYTRLCQRFHLEPHDEQARIWYQRFGHEPVPVWQQAVDLLVAEMRPPLVDHVLKALDRAQEGYRQVRQHQAQREARQTVRQLGERSDMPPEVRRLLEQQGLLSRNQGGTT